MTEAYADMLNEIGLDATPKILDGGVYFQTIGNEKTAAQTGFTNWFQDFPHPLNFYFLVDGDTIQPTNNQNFGNVDDPKINDEIDRLSLETDLEAVAGRLGGARRLSGRAAAVLHRPVRAPQAGDVLSASGSTSRARCSTRSTTTTTRAGRSRRASKQDGERGAERRPSHLHGADVTIAGGTNR